MSTSLSRASESQMLPASEQGRSYRAQRSSHFKMLGSSDSLYLSPHPVLGPHVAARFPPASAPVPSAQLASFSSRLTSSLLLSQGESATSSSGLLLCLRITAVTLSSSTSVPSRPGFPHPRAAGRYWSGPWPVRNRAAEQEVSHGRGGEAPSLCSHSPGPARPPQLHLRAS